MSQDDPEGSWQQGQQPSRSQQHRSASGQTWEFPPWGDPRWDDPRWQQWWYEGGWRYDPRWADPQWQQWWQAGGWRHDPRAGEPYRQPFAGQQVAYPQQPAPGAPPPTVTVQDRLPVPAEPLPYHLVLRGGRRSRWWNLLGAAAVPAMMFVVGPVLVSLVFVAGYALAGKDPQQALQSLTDLSDPSPLSLAFLNITLALGIPIAMLAVWLLHRLRPGWLSSVAGRLRWRWMGLCALLAIVALVATVAVAALLPSGSAGADLAGEPNPWTTELRNFLLVVLFLTPLQAAGEEYVFRGYLTQAFGGIVGGKLPPMVCRVVAVSVPAVLFAFAHGAQDAPIFVDRLAFGLVSGVLVIVTGGLEAGIAMHVLNNFLAFGAALAFSDMESALSPSGGSWWTLPSTLTQSLVYLGLCLLAVRLLRQRTRTDPERMARSRRAPVEARTQV